MYSTISNLNPEQSARIPYYVEKWQSIIFSTTRIDRTKATEALQNLYKHLDKATPKIYFFDSPDQARALLQRPVKELAEQLGSPIITMPLSLDLSQKIQSQIETSLWEQLEKDLDIDRQRQQIFQPLPRIIQQLDTELNSWETRQVELLWQAIYERQWEHLWEEQQQFMRRQVRNLPGGDWWVSWGDNLWQEWVEPIVKEVSKNSLVQEWGETFKDFALPWLQISNGLGLLYNLFTYSLEAASASMIDFCISELGCEHDQYKWRLWSSLMQECSWFFLFEKAVIVCDRPTKLHFDSENRLHGEGEAAIAFADGYSLYAYQGVTLPRRYGSVHPHQWQSQWLLTESNAELRRVLIQGIGYGRICQELQAVVIDSWREYTLLYIVSDIDVEPIYLLKMVCPSTNHIHVLRVPPHYTSAREAIRWANWDIDPEDFDIAT